MKKLKLLFIVSLIMMLMICVSAFAEGDGVNAPFDWTYLATIAGATAATLLIVQFTKMPLDKVWHIPTRVFVYFIALIILGVATYFTAGITVENALLAVVNAFIVALTAYGAYEVTFAKSDAAKKD